MTNIVSIRQFYASEMGQIMSRSVSRVLLKIWPNCAGDSVVTLGFAYPYLLKLEETASTVVPCMSGSQGGMFWPAGAKNRTVIVEDDALPLPSHSFNRAIVIHNVEYSRHVRDMMKSIREVLVPGGRCLFVVPNRRSFWAQSSASPLGSGQPFNVQQLRHRVEASGFTYVRSRTVLFTPPLNWWGVRKLSPTIEFLGSLLIPRFGGVIVMEVEKQIYASIPEPLTESMRGLLYPVTGSPAMGKGSAKESSV